MRQEKKRNLHGFVRVQTGQAKQNPQETWCNIYLIS